MTEETRWSVGKVKTESESGSTSCGTDLIPLNLFCNSLCGQQVVWWHSLPQNPGLLQQYIYFPIMCFPRFISQPAWRYLNQPPACPWELCLPTWQLHFFRRRSQLYRQTCGASLMKNMHDKSEIWEYYFQSHICCFHFSNMGMLRFLCGMSFSLSMYALLNPI